jgi:DeoR/GlpR family transcriptional regulator of sugar metabolism
MKKRIGMQMFQNQRREKILELLRENGSSRVNELSRLFNVTEPTIRQDLEVLEKTGAITRQHGGAFINNYSSFADGMQLEHRDHMTEKERIGQKAAEFVKSGDSIILDSGTTITEMVKHLLDRKNLNVVTTALNITLALGKEPSNTILLTGGEFKAPTLSLTGDRAVHLFENLYVEKLFLATGGFSIEAGLTYPGFSDIALKRAMVNSAKTIYLLADSSKLEKVLFASLGCQDKIDYIITDNNVSKEYVKELENIGISVIIC